MPIAAAVCFTSFLFFFRLASASLSVLSPTSACALQIERTATSATPTSLLCIPSLNTKLKFMTSVSLDINSVSPFSMLQATTRSHYRPLAATNVHKLQSNCEPTRRCRGQLQSRILASHVIFKTPVAAIPILGRHSREPRGLSFFSR